MHRFMTALTVENTLRTDAEDKPLASKYTVGLETGSCQLNALKVYATLMAHISARMMDLNPINYVN